MSRYLDLLLRHGIFNFFIIMIERFTPVGFFRYWYALSNNKVYFGEYLSARQGLLKRHEYMDLAVKKYIEQTGNKNPKILEVGSWAGGSALCFARALQRYGEGGSVTCVDIWEESSDENTMSAFSFYQKSFLDSMKSGKVFDLFKHNIKSSGYDNVINYHKIDFRKWDSDTKYDLIYIDGDHRYEAVVHDLNKSDGLLENGGFLMGDDLERQLDQVDSTFCEENLGHDFVYEPKIAKTHIHPGVTKGVYDFFKKSVSSYLGFFVMEKDGSSYKNVSL